MNKCLIAIILIGIVKPLTAQHYIAKPGSEAYYQVTQILDALQEHDTVISVWKLKVIKAGDSSISLDCTLKSYQKGIQPPAFSTEDQRHLQIDNTLEIENLMILDRSFRYDMNRDSNLLQPDLQKMVDERMAAWEIKESFAAQMRQNQQYGPYAQMRPIFPLLPATPTSLPAHWVYPDSSIRYSLTETKAGSVSIISRPNLRNGADSAGFQVSNYVLDPATGMVISAQITSILPQLKSTLTIDQVGAYDFHPINEDMRTAMVLPSFCSNALLNSVGYDSARIKKYFARFDPLFGERDFYKLIKLDLLTHDIAANMQSYDSLLLATPDSLIAGNTMHLFNKAQHVLNISPDSAYNTIKYLSRHKKEFRSWVQESFSQNWIDFPMDEARAEMKREGLSDARIDSLFEEGKKRREIGNKTFGKLLDDKDSDIQHEIYPLSLWVKSKKNASMDSLRQVARMLDQIRDSKEYSNPHRYALLIYKQLLAGGETAEADKFLDNQIASMLKKVSDSSGNDRYADQNMLAYAFKLKSDAVAKTDPIASMGYLAKAARYSPKNNTEKPYTSFYDRAFLHSQESYRPEFAEALIRQGDSKKGLLIMSEQVNADPDFFGELQKAFVKHYPKMDFYRFFNDVVVRSWKKAPGFILKSPDGKTIYKLSDFRGKWLLVDFWGTWCGPCRSEMPGINEFVQKIAGRQDLAFLSIASRDRPLAVTTFLAEHHYRLPVCMSDNEVDGKFGVTGYPGKFLVSPIGTVLPIEYGKDWQKAVEQMTALQPKQIQTEQSSKLQSKKMN